MLRPESPVCPTAALPFPKRSQGSHLGWRGLLFLLLLLTPNNCPLVSAEIRPSTKTTDRFLQNRATWQPCSDYPHSDIFSRPLLDTVLVRSRLECVMKCSKEPDCEIVLYTKQKNANRYSCHLLDQFDLRVTSDLDLGHDLCDIGVLNPCHNDGVPVQGLCHCPPGRTGQYCQLFNHASCNEGYTLVHIAENPANIVLSGLETLYNLSSQAVKVVLEEADQTCRSGTSDYLESYDTLWALQVNSLLSKEDLSTYKTNPKLMFHVVRDTARVHTLTVSLHKSWGNLKEEIFFLRIFVRNEYSQLLLMDETSLERLPEVFDALSDGYPVTSAPVVIYDPASQIAVRHHLSLGWNTDGYIPIDQNVNFLERKTDQVGERYIVRQYLDGRIRPAFRGLRSHKWSFDPCWYPATIDPRRPPRSSKSTKHLRKALQAGRRARVLVDGVSSQTQPIYITDNFVIFQTGPYITPKMTVKTNDNSRLAHLMVSTDGLVKTCSHLKGNSEATDHTEYQTDTVKWLIDSREWQLGLQTHMNGTHVAGDQSVLKSKLKDGADVQIVIDLPDGVTLSLPGHWMEWTLGTPGMSAEIKEVLSVTVTHIDFNFESPDHCAMMNFLISDSRGLHGYVYYQGAASENSHHLDLSSGPGQIRWFTTN